jgi:hypothetical protein
MIGREGGKCAMRQAAAIGLMILVVLPVAARATADMSAAKPTAAELFHEFGLLGTWAVDCRRPAAPDNPHVSDVAPSPDLVLERQDLGAGNAVNRYRVLAVKRLSATRLQLQVIFEPGSEGAERQRLVLVVRDGTRRTMFNQPEDGPVRVKDGVVLAFGVKTPLLRKCE